MQEEELLCRSNGIVLAGTIASPGPGRPFPGVLFISGSGPVDRNENSPYFLP